ncbi:MAG: hypothetical protein LUQ71_01415 [Methanoregula sp.]|nr:hypothetical protein [Methanoregula sp.]
MDLKLSDHVPIIIVLIIGFILVVDLVNVFFIGGPSFFSLIFKSGNAASASNTLPATGNSSVALVSAGTSTGSAIFVPTTATPVPVVSYISVVTPIESSSDDQPVYRMLTEPARTQPQDTYAYIYSGNLSYYHGEAPTAMAFDVKEPPLVINYQVIPMITDDSRIVKNQTESAKKAGQTDQLVNSTYASPQSAFTVTVYDRNSGGEIAQDGYGLAYGMIPEKTFTVREAGSYIIQLDGKFVDVHVDMLLKREGNIV